MKTLLLIVVITIVGLIFRLHNISPFKVYPDSYQSLIVAKNITDYHNVVGYLGIKGMLYPDFFSWTRPGYPLLIDLITYFTKNMTLAAQIITFTTGIAAIPLVFLFMKKLWNTNSYGLAGAFLLALSFNHTLWGGFIMTETVGVFLMLLFLFCLLATLEKKTSFLKNFITGVIFSLAILTRYEYVITILPVCFILFQMAKNPWRKISGILSGALLSGAFIALQLFPIQASFSAISLQLQDMTKTIILSINIFIALCITIRLLPKTYKKNTFNYIYKILLGFLWILAFLLLGQLAFGENFPFLRTNPSFVRNFVQQDLLISICSLIGLTLFIFKKKLKIFGLFVFLCLILLTIIYYRVNPDMDRYITHLIPFLLIPASYGLTQVISFIKSKRNFRAMSVLTILLLVTMFQTIKTYSGMRYDQNPSWYHISYEEKAAIMIRHYVRNDKPLLVVSLPEPYFYINNLSTQSITDTPPFIYIDNSLNHEQILLVVDMGMYEIFPNFTKFATNNLQQYKIVQFFVHEKYHYSYKIYDEIHPVSIYKLTVQQLKTSVSALDF